MARPERNNVDYFPFICEDGNKMYYIEETYGNDGFSTFVKLLRELAKTNYHYLDLSKQSTMMFLSAKCKVSKEILNAIICDLVDLGKFDKILWNENKIVWCQDFTDSIQDAYTKRNNKCITLEGLRILLTGLGVLKPSKLQSKGGINTQSIVEDSKVYKSKVNIPDFSEFLKYALEKKPKVSQQDLKLKYDSWVTNDWKNGNDKKISNWRSALLNTLPFIKDGLNSNLEKPFKPARTFD